jgi:hypothetical protein
MASEQKGRNNPHMDTLLADQSRERFAWFLCGAYPGNHRRKRVANDWGVSIETAKAWLTGTHMPRGDKLILMMKRWGGSFTQFVFAGMTPAQMEAEARAAEDRGVEMTRGRVEEDARGNAAITVARMGMVPARHDPVLGRGGSRMGCADEAEADPVSPRQKTAIVP